MYAATDNCAAAPRRRLSFVRSAYVRTALKRCTRKTERQNDRHGVVFDSVTVRSVHLAFPLSLQFDAER